MLVDDSPEMALELRAPTWDASKAASWVEGRAPAWPPFRAKSWAASNTKALLRCGICLAADTHRPL